MKTTQIHSFKPNVKLRGLSKGKDISPLLLGLFVGVVLVYFSYGVLMTFYDFKVVKPITMWYTR